MSFPAVLIIIGLGCLTLGAWGFVIKGKGRRWNGDGHLEFLYAGRLVFAGIVTLVVSGVVVFSSSISEHIDYTISYICLVLGIGFIAWGALNLRSRRAATMLGKMLEDASDAQRYRVQVSMTLIIIGGGLLFTSFLFYPTFIAIG